MKSCVFVFIVLVSCTGIKAQFSKGNYIVGGSVSGSFMSPNAGARQYNIQFNPKIGYYFLSRVAAGIDLIGVITKSSDRDVSTYYGAGPFVRYNFRKWFFVEGDYNRVVDNEKIPYADKPGYEHKSYAENRYTAGLGYVLLLNRRIALEPRLNYSVNSAFGAITSKGPGFSISFHSYL